jgi:hypothetical protein
LITSLVATLEGTAKPAAQKTTNSPKGKMFNSSTYEIKSKMVRPGSSRPRRYAMTNETALLIKCKVLQEEANRQAEKRTSEQANLTQPFRHRSDPMYSTAEDIPHGTVSFSGPSPIELSIRQRSFNSLAQEERAHDTERAFANSSLSSL